MKRPVYVLIFLMVLSETLIIVRRIQGDVINNMHTSACG